MAKTKKPPAKVVKKRAIKKATRQPHVVPKPEPQPPVQTASQQVLTPERVHELLKLHGPYHPLSPPAPWAGYRTVWDPGLSILDLRTRFWSLFYPMDWLDRASFAKQSVYGTWRQLRIAPIAPGKPFEEQAAKVPKGDEIPAARTLVTLLVIHLLGTGERLDIPRLRSGTVIAGGKRVIVGPFHEYGLDIGSCADDYASPGVGLVACYTPPPRKR